MSTRHLWVRQYAHSTQNMGRAHIAPEGAAFTVCALPLRDTAVWGHEYQPGRTVKDWCRTCAHHTRQRLTLEAARSEREQSPDHLGLPTGALAFVVGADAFLANVARLTPIYDGVFYHFGI